MQIACNTKVRRGALFAPVRSNQDINAICWRFALFSHFPVQNSIRGDLSQKMSDGMFQFQQLSIDVKMNEFGFVESKLAARYDQPSN